MSGKNDPDEEEQELEAYSGDLGRRVIVILSVVALLGILAAGLVPDCPPWCEENQAWHARVTSDIESFTAALATMRTHTGRLPTTTEGLESLLSGANPHDSAGEGWRGPYITKQSRDPWGNAYRYERPGKHGMEYDIWSMGKDEKLGTKDDIGNWNTADSWK